MPKKFTVLFVLLLLTERLSEHIPSLHNLYYIAKPAIVTSLLIYFIKHSKHLAQKTRTLTILALAFCILGDILLMFQGQSPNFFIAGLGAFLIGHVFYSILFSTKRNKNVNPLGFVTFLVVYALGLFYLFKDGLGAMLIPVCLYILVILIMATMAFLRKGNVSKQSYNWVLLGAIIFMLSDSTIAINKFYQPFDLAKDVIMVTYALAQYLIVFGILKQTDLNN